MQDEAAGSGLMGDTDSHSATPPGRRSGRECIFAALLALLCLALPAHALDPDKRLHHYVRDTWSIEQGLPQISALSLAQDAQGYLWAGTQTGVARFDGIRFVTYRPADTPELPGTQVQALLAGADGAMWIGTYKGLAVHRDGRFAHVPRLQADGSVQTLDVHALAFDAEGAVLVATAQGAFRVVGDRLLPLPAAPEKATYALHSEAGAIWLGVDGGVWRLVAGGAELLPLPPAARRTPVTHIVRAGDRLWAGTRRGLYLLDRQGWQAFDLGSGAAPPLLPPILALYEDRDGNLWASTTELLYRIQQGRVVEAAAGGRTSGAPTVVRAILEDREGSLWLGSQWEGITRLWNGWTERYSTVEGLDDPLVWSVARDPQGRVWIGGNDGLSVLEGARIRRVIDGASLPHPNVYTLMAEADTVWVGTRSGLVVWKDGAVDVPPGFDVLSGMQIHGVLRDSRGQLWIATTNGLFRQHGDRLLRYGRTEGLTDERVRVLRETADGELLLGTLSGLLRMRRNRIEERDHALGLPADLDVSALHQLPDGSLLLGTSSERIFHFDGARWLELSGRPGVPSNSPFFMADDSAGWMWVAGIRGVYRMPLGDIAAYRSGRIDRLRGEMLLNERGDHRGGQKGYCCNGAGNGKGFIHDDRLWLPTRDGVVTLTATAVRKNPVPPVVVLERVQVGGEWRALDGAAALGELAPAARDLGFEFTALSLQQPESVQLQYRLRGYDSDWKPIEGRERRSASYTNLPPGDYVFEVAAANNAGVRSGTPAQLQFRIPQYFHESYWSLLLLTLAGVAAGWGVSRWRVRVMRRQQRELEALVEKRTEALADANRQLERISQTDVLTALHNRRYLQEQLPADLAYYERQLQTLAQNDQVMVLALADIDHFKRINDQHGHPAGDEVLRQFAQILQAQVRSCDYVVRWGGEEFVLVFRPMPRSEAARIAERIRAAVAAHPFKLPDDGPTLKVTCSIGFIEYPLFRFGPAQLAWQQLVELADRALYQVKRHGRNGWATFRLAPGASPAAVSELLRHSDSDPATSELLQLVIAGAAGRESELENRESVEQAAP